MAVHIKKKFDPLTKKIEIEKLYRDIVDKSKRNHVIIEDDDKLKCELKRLGLSSQTDYTKDILNKHQREIIKDFKKNKNIIIRKADKANTFVIMNTQDDTSKIDSLLSDASKFEKSE